MKRMSRTIATGGSAIWSYWLSLSSPESWRSSPFHWKSSEGKMDIVREVLDKQVLDRHQRKMGRVDGIILEIRDGAPPRLLALEVGGITLARRLHPRLGKWLMGWLGRRAG